LLTKTFLEKIEKALYPVEDPKMLVNGMNAKVDRTVVEGASHLNNKSGPWWKDRGLRTLNFLIFIPLMSEYVQGYDASLINNVQQLPVWQKGMSALDTEDQ